MPYTEVQLGKSGISENFISTLKSHFKKHGNVRVSVLKNAGHTKDKVKEYCEDILKKLGKNYTARTIGFKIILKKWRRDMR